MTSQQKRYHSIEELLKETNKVYVKPEGSKGAEVIGVGEAPAANEVYKGKPFCGSAGQKLNDLLGLAGLFRENLYLTNISKVRAPNDKMSKMPQWELDLWKQDLIEEINGLYNPKIIIAFGNYALEALTNRTGITNLRGSPLPPKSEIKHDCVVIPTRHPSALHYHYELWPFIVADLTRVRMMVERDFEFEFPEFNFILKPSFKQIYDTLHMLLEINPEYLTLDVETPRGILSCIGIAWSRSDAICIPFHDGKGESIWSLEEEAAIWEMLAEILPQLNFANQNVLFDWRVLAEHGIHLKMPTWDPMLMHHCLYSEMPHKLDVITSIYTDIVFYKTDESEEKGSDLRAGKEYEHWKYNCYDCCAAWWSIEGLREELIEENMLDTYLNLYAEVIEPIFKMNMTGVRVDVERLEIVRKELSALVEQYTADIKIETGVEVNASSPKQVAELLYETLGWERYKGEATAEKTLEKLAYKYSSDIPKKIIDIRKARRELGLFSEGNIVNGRVYCEYSLSRTNTGRFASRKGRRKTGMNLQNVKRGAQRNFFLPEKGHLFICPDQKQAEAMIVGWYSQDDAMIALFKSGESIHIQNAYNVFGIHLTKDDPLYVIAKQLIHGGNYGLGPWKFARMTGLPFREGKEHLETYHNTYPGIRKVFHAHVQREIRRCRTLYNPFGRRQVFLGRINDDTFRAGYAFLPQSTISDINKTALKRISKFYYVPLEGHDGMCISVPEKELEYGVECIKEAYHVEFEIWGESHTVPISLSVGPSWGEQTTLF